MGKEQGMVCHAVAFCATVPPQSAVPDFDASPSIGKIVYPKEIENCEPCKRLWLANNPKAKHAAARDLREREEAQDTASTQDAAMSWQGRVAIKKSSDGEIVYPKEIENCEPCKRL